MVATLTATPNGTLGYVQLTLAGASNSVAHTITRTGGGVTATVRNGDPATTSPVGGWSGQDYEAPLDTNVSYTATAGTSPIVTVATSASIQLYSGNEPWLGSPGKPSLNFRPKVREFRLGTMAARSVAHAVIGRRLPIGQSLRRGSYAGELELMILNEQALRQVEAIIEDGQVLLYRAPWTWYGQGTRYLQVGDVSVANLMRVAWHGKWYLTLPWTEVDRPALLAEAGTGFSWASVKAAYGDWQAMRNLNPTWSNVLDGVP